MTQITKTTTKYGNAAFRVNGRNILGLARIVTIEQGACSYEWTGTTTSGWDFVVWGGKKSGGAANEWFVDFLGMSVAVKSPTEALRTINNA